jgi:hypothetical protein
MHIMSITYKPASRNLLIFSISINDEYEEMVQNHTRLIEKLQLVKALVQECSLLEQFQSVKKLAQNEWGIFELFQPGKILVRLVKTLVLHPPLTLLTFIIPKFRHDSALGLHKSYIPGVYG